MSRLEETLRSQIINPEEGDVIVITIDQKIERTYDGIKQIREVCKNAFPNNQILIIPNNINIDNFNKEKLISLYENILAKLKENKEKDNNGEE